MSRLIGLAAAISLVLTACAGTDAETTVTTQAISVAEGAAVATSLPSSPVTEDAVATTSLLQPQVEMRRVDDGSWFPGGWVTSVAVGESGLVVAGAVGAHPRFTAAAAWTSTAGETWVRVGDDPAVFGDESSADAVDRHQVITDLVSGSLGVVAVGVDGKPGDYEAAVWVSTDGLVWERLPHDEEVFGGEGDQIMRSVVQTTEAVVVVGESAGHATVWVSDDGRQWTRALIGGAADGSGRNWRRTWRRTRVRTATCSPLRRVDDSGSTSSEGGCGIRRYGNRSMSRCVRTTCATPTWRSS